MGQPAKSTVCLHSPSDFRTVCIGLLKSEQILLITPQLFSQQMFSWMVGVILLLLHCHGSSQQQLLFWPVAIPEWKGPLRDQARQTAIETSVPITDAPKALWIPSGSLMYSPLGWSLSGLYGASRPDSIGCFFQLFPVRLILAYNMDRCYKEWLWFETSYKSNRKKRKKVTEE